MKIKVKTEGFREASRRLKEAGEQDLRRELFAGLNRAGKLAREDVKRSMGDFLPGTYAAVLSDDFKVNVRSNKAAPHPNVTLTGKGKTNKRGVRPINQGVLRHPLFGNRSSWHTTRVRPGFWTNTLDQRHDEIRDTLDRAMNDVAEKIMDV